MNTSKPFWTVAADVEIDNDPRHVPATDLDALEKIL